MTTKKERLLKEVEEKVGKEVREVLQGAWEQFESSGYGIKGDLLYLYDVVEQALDHYQEVEIDPPAAPEQVKDKMRSKYVDLSDEDKEWVKNQVEKMDNPTLHRLFTDLVQEFPD